MAEPNASHYRKNSSTQYALAYEILNTIDFKGNETILDVGCGDGRITAEVSKHVPFGKVVGIDPSSSMINLALQSFHEKDYPNLSFEKVTAEELCYTESEDIVLVMNVLHWIREPVVAFRNIAASLRPGGLLFILTYPQESPYWRFLEETVSKAEWSLYVDQCASKTMLTTEKYKKIIEECGLIIEKCHVEEKVAVYSSADDLKAYIKGWLSCYLPLPQHLESRFLQKAIKNAKSYSLALAEIQLPYLKLVLKIRK